MSFHRYPNVFFSKELKYYVYRLKLSTSPMLIGNLFRKNSIPVSTYWLTDVTAVLSVFVGLGLDLHRLVNMIKNFFQHMRYREQLFHQTPNVVYCRWNGIQQRNVTEQSQWQHDPTIASACLSVARYWHNVEMFRWITATGRSCSVLWSACPEISATKR